MAQYVANDDRYLSILKESKGQPPPNFPDNVQGMLIALIKDRPTIWNAKAKLTRADVLASFDQCASILSNLDPRFSIWVIIEKWCWVVEAYIRGRSLNPPHAWRYNNALEFLEPFNTAHYPYLGCISKTRLAQLTRMYADEVVIEVMERTKDFDFSNGIFRDQLAYLAGEDWPTLSRMDIEVMKTVGQVVNAKRRGRPSKHDKRSSPIEQFIILQPQSAQHFQKLLEHASCSSASSSTSEPDSPDEQGFTLGMYSALFEMISESPETWQTTHPKFNDARTQEQLFEEFAKTLAAKFAGIADAGILEKLSGPFLRALWNGILEKFIEEDESDTPTKWRHFPALQFLLARSMPPFSFENVIIKSEDALSSGISLRSATVASPAGSTQSSEDSRMAASSPATSSQYMSLPASSGTKSIKAVLENLVAARSLKEEQVQGKEHLHSELKQILESKPNIEIDNGPAAKRVKQSASPPSRMIVYNEATRKATQAPVSTWVPPREDLAAKVKEETMSTPPRKAQATALVKSGLPLEKQLKKILQQTGSPMIPVTTASMQARNGLLLSQINQMGLSQNVVHQALLHPKIETSSSMSGMTPVMPKPIQAQLMMNGTMNGNVGNIGSVGSVEDVDKWALLGRLVTVCAREVESRNPLEACELYEEVHNVIVKHQKKSLLARENNSQQ